jgi:hypothetical protein
VRAKNPGLTNVIWTPDREEAHSCDITALPLASIGDENADRAPASRLSESAMTGSPNKHPNLTDRLKAHVKRLRALTALLSRTEGDAIRKRPQGENTGSLDGWIKSSELRPPN